VTVKRRDAQVRARSGFAITGHFSSEKLRMQDLRNAAASAFDHTAIVLYADTTPYEIADRSEISFRVQVPWSELQADAATGRRVIVDWMVLVKQENGQITARLTARTDVSLAKDGVTGDGPIYIGRIAVPTSGTYLVRFVARDGISGRMGTLTVEQRASK